jgi:hypothetical protein
MCERGECLHQQGPQLARGESGRPSPALKHTCAPSSSSCRIRADRLSHSSSAAFSASSRSASRASSSRTRLVSDCSSRLTRSTSSVADGDCVGTTVSSCATATLRSLSRHSWSYSSTAGGTVATIPQHGVSPPRRPPGAPPARAHSRRASPPGH